MRRRSAMTLVELLVVISIVGLMVALLLPAIQAARAAARTNTCRNNMRQIGLAIHSFADVRQGKFPWNSHKGMTESWVYSLGEFAENVDVIRMCPDDPKTKERLTGEFKGTSYIINEYVTSSSELVVEAKRNLKQIKETSKFIILFEGADDRGPTDDHAHCSTWFEPTKVALKLSWKVITREIQPDRHSGTAANYLYADGHVDSITSEDLYAIVEKDMAQGTNFARPN